jgi:hypothetical protein
MNGLAARYTSGHGATPVLLMVNVWRIVTPMLLGIDGDCVSYGL